MVPNSTLTAQLARERHRDLMGPGPAGPAGRAG